MNLRKWLLSALLVLAVSPASAQTVKKVDVLGAVRMSASLAQCGFNDASLKIGKAALQLLPRVGLHDKSDEVVQALKDGMEAVKDGTVSCGDVVEFASKAGIM